MHGSALWYWSLLRFEPALAGFCPRPLLFPPRCPKIKKLVLTMLLRMLFPIGQLVSCALLLYTFCTIFAALHGMQTRSSDDNSVRLVVCLSVKRVDCEKKTEE